MPNRLLSNPSKILILIGLLVLSVLGNVTKIHLFFGVEFIFGSIFTLITLSVFGLPLGIFSAALGGIYIYLQWQHPYASLIFIAEAAFISLTLARFRGFLILASATFWILFGIPLVLLTYHFLLGIDFSGVAPVALKQAINSAFNATLAGLILSNSRIRNYISRDFPHSPLAPSSALQKVFGLVVTAVLLPSILMLVIHARGIMSKINEDQRAQIDAITTGVSNDIRSWKELRLRSVEELARAAQTIGVNKSKDLQLATELITRSSPDFHNMYVADRNGTTVAFYPERNERGESTIGLNFSDRPYYEAIRISGRPYISEVFIGRGGVFVPIIVIAAPVMKNGGFEGLSVAGVDLSALTRLIRDFSQSVNAEITLLTKSGQIVASTQAEFKPMEMYQRDVKSISETEGGYFIRRPKEKVSNRVILWQKSFFGKESPLEGIHEWRLLVETPIAPHQSYLNQQYLSSLMVLLFVFLCSLPLAYIFSRKVTDPIVELAKATTDLPKRLMHGEKEQSFPETDLAEVKYLIQNFKSMSDELKERFRAQEETNYRLNVEIRERRKVEDELHKSNRLKDEFLASVSHELRTPLNVIGGYVEILSNEGFTKETPSFLSIVSRNVKQLTRLIEDLLDLSRISSGSMSLNRQEIDLVSLAKNSIETVKIHSDQKSLKMELTIKNEIPEVEADPGRLNQVFNNLLTNAIKFTPEGGRIILSLEKKRGEVEVGIEDNGEGISPEFLPFIFNRFQQENGSLNRAHGGLGLGLSIVREIVELHGGRIRAESKGKQMGAKFIFTLPFRESDV